MQLLKKTSAPELESGFCMWTEDCEELYHSIYASGQMPVSSLR